MIVTSPRRARRSRLSRRRPLRAAVALVVGALLALPTGTALAATPTPSPTPTAPPGAVTFTLAPVGNGVVRPGDGLAVSVTVQNTTASATAQADVTLSIGTEALADRADLTDWLDGNGSGVDVTPIGTVTVEPVQSGGLEASGILLGADQPTIAALQPGVYPLVASYRTASGTVSSTSAVVVPSDTAQLGVGVVVPITAAPRAAGLLTADELTALTAPDGELTGLLDAVSGTSAVLAVDPAIAAAIRVLGTSAPVSATDWLARLLALDNTRVALQFGDADAAAQVEAGLQQPQQPTSLTAYMDPLDFATVTPSPSPTPSPSATPGAPALPDLAQLLDVDAGRADVYWPAVETTAAASIDTLGALATDDQPSLTLVSSAITTGDPDAGAHAAAGTADLLVYDADVSRELSRASTTDETSLRGAPLTAATAYLAFAAAESGGGDVLVAFDRATERTRAGLRTAVGTAFAAPGATPRTLAALTSSPARSVGIVDAPLDAEAGAEASALFTDEGDIARFATVLDDPALLTGPERAEMLQLLGVAWYAQPDAHRSALATHREESRDTLDAVSLVQSPPINLLGSGAGMWFTVRNDLPYPVNLVLFVTPDDLRLDVQRATTFVATASSNTRVDVPVQARVGNGEVGLTLQLRSRASVAIGDEQSVEVTVRAEWETIGLVALGVIIGGLLLLGVVRTVLRARSRRRAKSGADASSPASSSSDPSDASSTGGDP